VFANAQEIYACELTVTLAERTPAGTDSGPEEDNEAWRKRSNHTEAGHVLLAFGNLRTCASDLNQRHRRWFDRGTEGGTDSGVPHPCQMEPAMRVVQGH